MAVVSLDSITDMVGLRLNEFPECRRSATSGSSSTSLSEMIGVILEDEARKLTRESSLDLFTTALDFSQELRLGIIHSPKESSFLLPPDFCRLHSLRMTGWERTLTELSPGEPLRSALGAAAPEWMAERMDMPWLRLGISGRRRQLVFGPTPSPIPVAANYIPLPSYDPDLKQLDAFDPSLIPGLISALSTILLTASA